MAALERTELDRYPSYQHILFIQGREKRMTFTFSLLKEEEDEFCVFESEPFYMHYELHLCFFTDCAVMSVSHLFYVYTKQTKKKKSIDL